jgi:hypothetical protein
MIDTLTLQPDLIALDRDNRIVLAGIPSREETESAARIAGLFEETPTMVFGLTVTHEWITIYGRSETSGVRELIRLAVPDVLSVYDKDLPTKLREYHAMTPDQQRAYPRVSFRYLVALSDAWLRDVAYGWRRAPIPAKHELDKIGLSEAIRDGDTRHAVEFVA